LKPSFSEISKSSQSPIIGTPSLEEQLRAASASPSVATQPLPGTKVLASKDVAHAVKSLPLASRTGPSSPAGAGTHLANVTDDAHALSSKGTSPAPAVQHAVGVDARISDGPSADPSAIEDAARDANAASAESQPKAPQVVHLPPEDVQEARLHETERKLERAAEKERKEDEKQSHANGPADLISSPSSTVGPYSQATPHAPHHSPDTSPDTDSYHERPQAAVQPTELLDPAAQQVKEDHERALQKQMNEARERARGSESPTPDIEKQIEDEQAIRLARDGKSRLGESTTGSGTEMMSHASEVARDAAPSSERFVEVRTMQDPAADSLPTPTTTAPEPSTVDPEATDHDTDKMAEADSHPTPPADIDIEMSEEPTLTDSKSPPSRPDRMTTRVSSGAIRQKSVSDILADKAAPRAVLTPRSSNLSTSVSPPRPKIRDPRSKEVVVFAKKNPRRGSKALQAYNEDYASLQGASEDSSRDYLEGLFKYQAHHPPRSIPLQELVASARKTVTTAGTLAMHREHQDYKILKRVYQLQNANRWSLRQLQKSVEPERPFTHHDQLLLEMKNISTDFKEERKWKLSQARNFAKWCAAYVCSSPEERVALRVNARIPNATKQLQHDDEDMNDAPTPDLVQSHAHETESESFADEDELRTPLSTSPPTGLFSLGFDDVVMKIHRTPASDTMFRELPFYEPMLEGSSDGNPFSVAEPPILPVSKYVTGKLVSQIQGPPRKRSRYDYDSEDEPSSPPSRSGTSAEHSMPSTPGRRLFCRNDLPPEMTDVALFNAENKHVRDRLQAAHQFRPPTEFNMPSVAFFEHRIPSQWLWEEDQKLRSLVKEFTFNWSLVSQQLSLPSMFVSGSGRRTPWECFERWVQLEGLPAEMSKTQYFRTYQGRLEQANKTVFAQYQAQQQQQQQQQGSAPAQPRRRPTTTPIRVERRRENRHLAIIDGMRKLARKRESAAHKQAESQKAAALRKAHEPAPPKSNVHTPQEFSRLKWEREEKLKLRQQQQELAVRVSYTVTSRLKADPLQQQMMQQRQQAQVAAQGGMPNGANQMPRNGASMGNPNGSAHMANSASQQGQNAATMAARAHQGQQGMQANFGNGNMAGMPMGTPGVPQAQMQGNMQNGQRMGPPNQMQMAMQRGQFPNNAQQQFQLQQQHQMSMAGNLTQGMGMNNNIPNANMMASLSNQNMNGNLNGNMNTAMNGLSNNVGSPRPNQGNGNMQTPARPLSSGHMPGILQLQNTYKVQHPEWTPEQIQKAASDQLQKFMAKQQRAQAINAAAGSSGMSPSPQIGNNHYLPQNGNMANSPQPASNNAVVNYQQQLVQQQRMMQQSRQQAGSPGMNAARPVSRSATPQNPQMLQSPGMQQAQVNRS
jgi:chromatin modification-related protein VID21